MMLPFCPITSSHFTKYTDSLLLLLVPFLLFFLFSATLLLLVLLLWLRLVLHGRVLLRLLFVLHSRLLLLWLRLMLHGRVLLRLLFVLHSRLLLLWLGLVLHGRVLLRLLFVLHSRLLLLWLGLVLHSRVLLFRGCRLSRPGFASFGAGWSSVAALESFLPPTALAMMVLLKKFLIIMLTLPVFAPIRILPLKTLPVLRLSVIPRHPSRSIPGFGSDDIGGSISVIWGPTVFRAEKIVQDAIQKPVTVVIDPRRIRPHPG
ncbi:MAG: hypothetical protein ABSG91_10260 [Syntrophobacteraceae bacterium]